MVKAMAVRVAAVTAMAFGGNEHSGAAQSTTENRRAHQGREGQSKAEQLSILRALWDKGALLPTDVPDWARTCVGVAQAFSVFKGKAWVRGSKLVTGCAVTFGLFCTLARCA